MAEVCQGTKTAKIFLIIMCSGTSYKIQNIENYNFIFLLPTSSSFLFIWNGGKMKEKFLNIFLIHKSMFQLQEPYGRPNSERTLLPFLHSNEMPIILFGHWPPDLVCRYQVISYCSSPSPFLPHCCKWHMCDILELHVFTLATPVSPGDRNLRGVVSSSLT